MKLILSDIHIKRKESLQNHVNFPPTVRTAFSHEKTIQLLTYKLLYQSKELTYKHTTIKN